MKNSLQKGSLSQVVIVFVAIILIAGGAYYFATKNKKLDSQTENNVKRVDNTQSINNTQVYKNEAVGVEFEYPESTKVDDSRKDVIYVMYKEPRYDLSPEEGKSLEIRIVQNSLEETLAQYRASLDGDYVGLKTSVSLWGENEGTLIEYVSALGTDVKELFIIKDNKKYLIKLGLKKNDREIVLSSLDL